MTFLSTSLLIAAISCAPKPFPEDALPVAEERPVYGDFASDYETVWEATIEVLGEAAPLDEIDKNGGRVVTGWVSGFSDYIFKTYGGTRIPEPIRYRLLVDVTNRGGRTEVRMVNQEQVEKDMISVDMEFTGSIYQWLDVPSSTTKEREMLEEIYDVIEDRATGGGGYDYNY
jgi:hypothetical protein